MFIIFNKEDDSCSWYGEVRPPESMVNAKQYLVNWDSEKLSHIPTDELPYMFLNKETGEAYVPENMIFPGTSRGNILLEDSLRNLLLMAPDQRPPFFDKICRLSVDFLGEDKVSAMFADNELTDEEAQQILGYLDGDTSVFDSTADSPEVVDKYIADCLAVKAKYPKG